MHHVCGPRQSARGRRSRRRSHRAPGPPTPRPTSIHRAVHHVAPAVARRAPDRCQPAAPRRRRRARCVPPDLLAHRGDLGDDLGELVGVLEVDQEEHLELAALGGLALPVPPPHRVLTLNRPGQKPHAVDRVVLTTVVHGLARPRRPSRISRASSIPARRRSSVPPVIESSLPDRSLPRPTPSVGPGRRSADPGSRSPWRP